MKAVKFTVSGSYADSEKKIYDFESISIVVPTSEEDVGFMHLRSRYLAKAISEDKRYPRSVDRIREVFIDDLEHVDEKFSFFGKDIRTMDSADLQDLATYYDLRRIPLPRTAGIRSIRFIAYREYSASILRKPLPKEVDEQMMPTLPELLVNRPESNRAPAPVKLSLQAELDIAKSQSELQNVTLEQLREIAKKRGVVHAPNIGFDTLMNKLQEAG